MSRMSLSDAIALARAHVAAGRLDEARLVCHAVLDAQPQCDEAYQLLGAAAYSEGRFDEALAYFQHAAAFDPQSAAHHSNLSVVLMELGRGVEAETAARRAIELAPDDPLYEAHLANALAMQDRWEEAQLSYERALAANPAVAKTWSGMAGNLLFMGRMDEAEHAARRALELEPNMATALCILGMIYMEAERFDEADRLIREALRQQPFQAAIHCNMGLLARAQGRREEAIALFRRAVELAPMLEMASVNLGTTLREAGRPDEAEQTLRAYWTTGGRTAKGGAGLASTVLAQGKASAAAEILRDVLAQSPAAEAPRVHSQLLMTLQYDARITPTELTDAHREWDQRHGLAMREQWRPWSNDRDPQRQLRLGFVSADLRAHPVGLLSFGVLAALDPAEFDVVLYRDGHDRDPGTERFECLPARLRRVARLSDHALADVVRQDQIDILFDLAGHTAAGRAMLFARKPAPIQITWLGYEGTTGLSAIDYLLVDPHLVPVEQEPLVTERVLRLPCPHVHFEPIDTAPAVGPLPALSTGHVTLGCFNNPAKLTPDVVAAWSAILRQAPNARLLLKYRGFGAASVQAYYSAMFEAHGIDPRRIEYQGASSFNEMLATHARVDLALDPFPFQGLMTTCIALWMGVPVVSFVGQRYATRHSVSLFSHLGQFDTLAADQQAYVDLAVALCNDLDRLAQLRAALRPALAASPLCDARRTARLFGQALRGAWAEWCRQG